MNSNQPMSSSGSNTGNYSENMPTFDTNNYDSGGGVIASLDSSISYSSSGAVGFGTNVSSGSSTKTSFFSNSPQV